MASHPLESSKTVCVALIGLFASLVALNNVLDYGSNFEFVRHVLSMDTTFNGNQLMYRAMTSPAIHHFAYWIIIKTIYALYPEAMNEDTYAPIYMAMIADLDKVMGRYRRIMFAAGHEHSMQLFRRPHAREHGPEYTLVSGAGNSNKVSGVWHNDNTRFALSQEGFIELSVTGDGVYLQAFDIHTEGPVAGFWLDI